jgi:hypothetical protein
MRCPFIFRPKFSSPYAEEYACPVLLSSTASVVQWSGFLATDPQVRVRFLALIIGLCILLRIYQSTYRDLRTQPMSVLESREYDRGVPPRWSCDTLLPINVGSGRSVGIVRSRTKATEILLVMRRNNYYCSSYRLLYALSDKFSGFYKFPGCNSVHWEELSDRLCCLVIRVPGYITKMHCASCEVRTEFIYVM